MSEPIFTLANQLTLLRMALVPPLVLLILGGRHGWALVVFVVAGLSDALDGFAARRGGQQTTLGAMLDPVADKVLMGAAYVALTWGPKLVCPVPVWLTVTLLFRDGMTLVAVAIINLTVGRRVFAPSALGKTSTFVLVLTAGAALLANALGACPAWMRALFAAALALTVATALHYVWAASHRRQPR